MTNYEYLGMFFAIGLPVIVSAIALMKPVINLNKSIAILTHKIEELTRDNAVQDRRLDKHGDQIDDHESRLTVAETKLGIKE